MNQKNVKGKVISLYLVLFFLSITKVYAAPETQDLKSYVENLLDQSNKMLHDTKLSAQERHKKTNSLIRSHLYLQWMAEHSLGRFKRGIPQTKIDKFVNVYSKFIVKAYSDLADHYNGERAVFTGMKKLDTDLYIVNTEIVKPGTESPIKVDYLVHKLNNPKTPYLVGDIITEGISILNSQQSEFNNILATRGIDGLISDLQKKINSGNAHT